MSHWKKQIVAETWRLVFLLALGMTTVLWGATAQAQTSGDPYPTNSISFFASSSCPAGWSPYAPAKGLFIVPTPRGATTGEISGTPLDNLQAPTHTHSLSNTVEVKGTEYAGASGCCAGGAGVCCNKSVSTSGIKHLESDGDTNVTTAPMDPNIPYIQLLVCKKTAAPTTNTAPTGVIAFFEATEPSGCPAGWGSSTLTEGRFLVGLPAGASPAAFGGDPLKSLENRNHKHEYKGTLDTDSAGIALTTGCCAKGYGKDGKYSYSGSTKPEGGNANLPYIQLLQCEKK
jgi:hypothetical protein